ncbi:MAG: PLP-dependent transferase, partial [Pseudomonadota bacterium]|nr:PLP-dependent transferase [Pseudomonadota bacterium]
RLDYLETATLEVARWLEDCPHVETVLHPALPACPGHDHWKRDFTGSASVFSFTFKDSLSAKQVETFLDSLSIFRIGLSWGGVTSLAVVYPDLDRPGQDFGGRLVRLNIGMEATADLITDLESAMTAAFER